MANEQFREQHERDRQFGLKARQETRQERAIRREELEALRALWWFLENEFVQGDPGDGGTSALVPWASLVDLWDLHDAVEEIYQRHGYPDKPAREIGTREAE